MSLTLALIGYFFLAIVVLLDKKIVSGTTLNPVVYTFYSTIFLLVLFLFLPFGTHIISPLLTAYSVISGVTFGLALWTMFVAMKHAEASHLGPFIGACITVATFFFGSFFLAERLTLWQQIGSMVLVASSLMLSFEKTKHKTGLNRGYVWGIVAGSLFGLSHVAAKVVYEGAPFFTGIIWTKGTAGLFAVLLLFFPVVRNIFHRRHKKTTGTEHKKKQIQTMRTVVLVVSNKILSVAANGLIQYAIAIGSVTLVNALSGFQYAFLFLMVLFFSKYYKHVFQEYMTRREIVVQSVAIVFVIIGAGLFVL